MGSLTDVLIERVRATKPAWKTGSVSTITGIPEARPARVEIRDAWLEMPCGVATVPGPPPERVKDYPQSNEFGPTPAWGFYVRHADQITLRNVRVVETRADARSWLAIDDAQVDTPGSGVGAKLGITP